MSGAYTRGLCAFYKMFLRLHIHGTAAVIFMLFQSLLHSQVDSCTGWLVRVLHSTRLSAGMS